MKRRRKVLSNLSKLVIDWLEDTFQFSIYMDASIQKLAARQGSNKQKFLEQTFHLHCQPQPHTKFDFLSKFSCVYENKKIENKEKEKK